MAALDEPPFGRVKGHAAVFLGEPKLSNVKNALVAHGVQVNTTIFRTKTQKTFCV